MKNGLIPLVGYETFVLQNSFDWERQTHLHKQEHQFILPAKLIISKIDYC